MHACPCALRTRVIPVCMHLAASSEGCVHVASSGIRQVVCGGHPAPSGASDRKFMAASQSNHRKERLITVCGGALVPLQLSVPVQGWEFVTCFWGQCNQLLGVHMHTIWCISRSLGLCCFGTENLIWPLLTTGDAYLAGTLLCCYMTI